MNSWIKKSFKLAEKPSYLDNLFQIYPMGIQIVRPLSDEVKKKIISAFKNKDKILLLNILLDLHKFPLDDPYVASLRKDRDLIKKNPKVVKRITDTLFSLGQDTVISLASRPKPGSKQQG